MMKKALLVLVLILSASVLFAQGATDDGLYRGIVDQPIEPATLNRTDKLNYSLYYNASKLAEKGLVIQVPYIESSSYNVSTALKDKGFAEALSNITKLKISRADLVAYLMGLVMATGSGYNDIISADTVLGAQVGHMGFGLIAKADMQSMPPIVNGEIGHSTSPAGNGYVPELNFAFTFAYGRRIIENDLFTMDVGGAVRYAQKVYLNQITLSTLSDILDKKVQIDTLAARGGFAIPVDLGVTMGFLDGRLEVFATANNLNGYYYMWNYDGYKDALLFKNGYDSFVMYTPFSLGLGVSYDPKFRYVDPSISFAFNGINLYMQNDLSKEHAFLELFKYIDANIYVDILDILNVRASYRNGYPQFGLGFDVYGNMVELSYGFHEAGEEYGLRPVDALTIRVKLGYEKKR